MIVVGIDPGWSGGVFAIDEHEETTFEYHSFDKKTENDIIFIIEGLVEPCVSGTGTAYIEAVHSMPHDAAKAAFKFGWAYGMARAVVINQCWKLEEVTPLVWQRAFGMVGGGLTPIERKRRSLAMAQRVFPSVEFKLTGQKSYYDAALIAEYGRRRETGTLAK